MEWSPVHRGQALGRVGDPIAGHDLDLEPLVPAPRVRMFCEHPHWALQEVPEGEAVLLQPFSREFRGKGDEHVDLRLVEVDALSDAPDEKRLRVQPSLRNPLREAGLELADDDAEAGLLVLRREYFLENPGLDGVHGWSEPKPAIKNSPRSRRIYGRRPFNRAAAMTPLMTNWTAIAARSSPRIREIASVPVRPIRWKIRSA